MSTPRAADFIEVYEDALDPVACSALIERFERSGQAARGRTGGGVNVQLKDSWDIPISGNAAWADDEQALNLAALRGLSSYVRTYPYTVLAPLHLQRSDPTTGTLAQLDASTIAAMDDEALATLLTTVFRPGTINLQKYMADEGGYPRWHSEQYPRADGGETLHRVVLWTIYLNATFCDGETEFLHQRCKIIPKTGALLIAPAGFTHTHRGNVPRGGDKYIATSWILFQRAETLYAAPKGPPAP